MNITAAGNEPNHICAKIIPFENDLDISHYTLSEIQLSHHETINDVDILGEILHLYDFQKSDSVYLYTWTQSNLEQKLLKTLYQCIEPNTRFLSHDFYWNTLNYFQLIDFCPFDINTKVLL